MGAFCLFICNDRPDAERFKQYAAAVRPTLADYDVKDINLAFDLEQVEGDRSCQYVALIEFGSLEQARAWYFSDAYQAIRHYRTDGASYDSFIFEGASRS